MLKSEAHWLAKLAETVSEASMPITSYAGIANFLLSCTPKTIVPPPNPGSLAKAQMSNHGRLVFNRRYETGEKVYLVKWHGNSYNG